MEQVMQYGALGILAVVVIFGFLGLIKWLTEFIKDLCETNKEISMDFKNTIDNHLNCQAKVQEELVEAIRQLCRLWENGK